MKALFGVFFFLFALNSWALPESELGKVYEVLKGISADHYIEYNSFMGKKNVVITYMRMGEATGENGAVVISPGRAEAAVQYVETILDLMAAGYSPVYVIDHRGQGFSERELVDRQKGYVADFNDYVLDFETFMKHVHQDPNVDKKKIYLVSHSMGAAIGTMYLQKHPSVFKSAVMIAPMHKIYFESGTEDTALLKTAAACYLPLGPSCLDYIPPGGPYKEEPLPAGSTLSKDRWELIQWQWRERPELQLGGSTVRWGREAIQANKKMRQKKNVQKIKTPFLILQAENDKTVDNSGQDEVCSHSKLCTKVLVKKGNHRLLLEKDKIRDAVVGETVNFLGIYN